MHSAFILFVNQKMKLNLTLHRHQYFSKIYDQTLKINLICWLWYFFSVILSGF